MNYWDHASTTYVYPEAVEAMVDVIKNHWGNSANLHSFGLESAKLVEEAREKIAKAVGALPEEIIFTSGACESNAFAIHQREACLCSLYEHADIKANKKTSVVDNNYISRIAQVAKIEQELGSTDWHGFNFNKYLYAKMLVNNETGEIFDVEEDVKVAHSVGMWVLIDATQALGNIPIDVHELGAEFVSFSFHKVHGPKGIGAVYVKKEIQSQLKPLIYGSQEFGLRGGTSNVPSIVGAGVAVEKAVKEMTVKAKHSAILTEVILEELKDKNVPYLINQGNVNIPSILNISFPNITGEALMLALDIKGIQVSTGSACNSGDLKPSEVLTAMKVPQDYIQGAIRISISLENSMQDAIKLAREIANCYKELIG